MHINKLEMSLNKSFTTARTSMSSFCLLLSLEPPLNDLGGGFYCPNSYISHLSNHNAMRYKALFSLEELKV